MPHVKFNHCCVILTRHETLFPSILSLGYNIQGLEHNHPKADFPSNQHTPCLSSSAFSLTTLRFSARWWNPLNQRHSSHLYTQWHTHQIMRLNIGQKHGFYRLGISVPILKNNIHMWVHRVKAMAEGKVTSKENQTANLMKLWRYVWIRRNDSLRWVAFVPFLH